MSLKILILTPRVPFPLRDGGSIAMNQSIEGYLGQKCEVSLFALNTSRHWVDESTLPPLYSKLKKIKTVFIKTDVNPLSAFFNLFTDKSYNVERFANKNVEQELIELLQSESFDVIQFESIYTSPYLETVRTYSQAKCLCRVHNIEHVIWQRLSEHETSVIKKTYLKLLTGRLLNYELDILKYFDLLLPISQKEADFFTNKKINRCLFVPFGVGHLELPQEDIAFEENSCYHIGSMDWMPNIEGILWFLDEVWGKFSEEMPHIKLCLAGKKMPASLISKETSSVKIIGEIDDFIKFSLQKNIMIVPLLSGAGIRIKIIEAMALGKTIITTSIGAEGIGATHMKEIIICNTQEEFVECLKYCFNEKDEAKMIGQRAKEFVEKYYKKEKIYADLVQRLSTILKDN